MTFQTLPIGETFSFLPSRTTTQRVLHYWKISARGLGYRAPDGTMHVATIQTWHVPVYQQGLTGCVYVDG
jgi:hypothetical protein